MSLKTKWAGASYAKKGFYIGLGVIVLMLGYFMVAPLFSYDGTCRSLGLFFGSTGPWSCSFAEHYRRSVDWTVILLLVFWWAPILILLVPTLIGFVIDKLIKRKANTWT